MWDIFFFLGKMYIIVSVIFQCIIFICKFLQTKVSLLLAYSLLMYRVFPRSTKRCHLCKIMLLWHVSLFLKTFDFWLHFIFQFWNWCCQHGISCYNIVFLRCLLFWDLLSFLLFIIFLGQKSLYYLHYCIDYIWYFNRRSNYTLMNFYLEKMKVIHLGTFLIRSQNTNLKTSVINQVKNHLAMKFVLKKGKNEDVLISQKPSMKHWPRLNHPCFLAQMIWWWETEWFELS